MIYNTFRIQYADSIACVFYYIAFTEYIISGNTVRLLSPEDYQENEKIT